MQRPSSIWLVRLLLALCVTLPGLGCAKGAGPTLGPVPRQRVAVNETLRVSLAVQGAMGERVFLRFEGPELPGLDRTAFITGDSRGGEFRWTPLVSHVGSHEFVFVLVGGGGNVLDTTSTVIDVRPSSDAAPVFLRPGAGATFDLTREPCVTFEIEVRDDDSSSVEIRARKELPDGARLTIDGPKRAYFDWCPSPDQAAAAERWTIQLEASDGDHVATEHDFVIVLRAGMKEGCDGAPPSVRILTPGDGERVTSDSGYTVTVEALDDRGLRDAPIVYYSTHAPDDLSSPDLTTFELLTALPDGRNWRARIPSLGLDDDEMRDVYLVASATDNDDPTGALCDHRTDSRMVRFVAAGGGGSGTLLGCAPCSSSSECESNICATTASGGRCLEACPSRGSCPSGECVLTSTREGASRDACGTAAAVCDMGGSDPGGCTEDSYEENDSIATATTGVTRVGGGQICADDVDYYRVDISSSAMVNVTLDFTHASGDLDLRLVDGSGTILETSAGVSNRESVAYCQGESEPLYARVEGYLMDENSYELTIETSPDSCCRDDASEDDDSLSTARSFAPSAGFDGVICPSDDDYHSFKVSDPSSLEATLIIDAGAGDLDLELYGPTGAVVGSSAGVTDTETIRYDVTETGIYTLRVFGFLDASGSYIGDVELTAASGCMSSADCPSGQVCGGGRCGSGACSRDSDCPPAHICPEPGPSGGSSTCGEACTVNRDCKSTEACKWFPRGRYCGARGSAANGAGCGTFGDCGGQRACIPWSGGYCARAGCLTNSDCEAGTVCVQTMGTSFSGTLCAVDCLFASEICRETEGYGCEYATSGDATSWEFACLPASS